MILLLTTVALISLILINVPIAIAIGIVFVRRFLSDIRQRPFLRPGDRALCRLHIVPTDCDPVVHIGRQLDEYLGHFPFG